MDQDSRGGAGHPRSPQCRPTKSRASATGSGLHRSSRGILRLLALGCEQGGVIPTASTYTWRNLPLDVGHVLGYFVAHEAHHRGQIVLVARALGDRLPAAVTDGLWQWAKRSMEAKAGKSGT